MTKTSEADDRSESGPAPWRVDDPRWAGAHCDRCGELYRTADIAAHQSTCPTWADLRHEIDALLAYLRGGFACTHNGIGLPGCPTCEGRWSRDTRALVQAATRAGAIGVADACCAMSVSDAVPARGSGTLAPDGIAKVEPGRPSEKPMDGGDVWRFGG